MRARTAFCIFVTAGFASAAAANGGANHAQILAALREIARPTALVVLPPPNNVKFLALGVAPNGEVRIVGGARGTGHDGKLCHSNASATAHWHTKEMVQGPDPLDYQVAASEGCSLYVISADGNRIWQVSVENGQNVQRPFSAGGA